MEFTVWCRVPDGARELEPVGDVARRDRAAELGEPLPHAGHADAVLDGAVLWQAAAVVPKESSDSGSSRARALAAS